jgi:hypothetical protein
MRGYRGDPPGLELCRAVHAFRPKQRLGSIDANGG